MFAISSHNANVERVFSLMNIQWTDERNQLDVTTVEALLQTCVNYNFDCEEFYKYALSNKNLLRATRSSLKYEPTKN